MKRSHLAGLAMLLLASVSTATAQALLDEWWTPGFNARVKLTPCEDKLCGTIVWAWDEHPPGAADKRPLVGQRIISGMRSSDGQVYAGSIYNPEDGQTYKATMRLKTQNTLLVEGCVLFICRAQIWRRHDSLRSPPVSPP